MKITFIGSKFYNGDPRSGLSYEYTHLAGTLLDLGLTVLYVDTMQPNLTGRLERAAKESDVIVYTPSELEMDWRYFATLNQPKVLLLCDDEWRREYGLRIAPYADFIMTTARDGKAAYGEKYISFQWGARMNLYKSKQPTIPISFIGLNYGYRADLVKHITSLGLPVQTFGKGWGVNITDEQIVDVLTSSKISLTTSTSSRENTRQIKARNFEIPASGALSLAEYAPGLEEYYVDGKEAVFWHEPRDLADKLYFYLTNEGARRRVAMAGRQRTAKDHDYRKRFVPMLQALGVMKV